MSMEKDGYEVLTDPTEANDLKKAKRRWGLICANASETMRAGYNSQGGDFDRNPAVPLGDSLDYKD